MKKNRKIFKLAFLLAGVLSLSSCINEDYDPDNLPGVGGIEDLTAPSAAYSYSVSTEDYLILQFINESESATEYEWILPEGASLYLGDNPDSTLSDENIQVQFDDLGLYEVSLIAKDNLGVSSETYSEEIDVIVVAGDPDFINDDFSSLGVFGRSNPCSCHGWINESLGTGAETTGGDTVFDGSSSDVIKFDNDEVDIAYQEIEVVPNTRYSVNYTYEIRGDAAGTSSLEFRVLSSAGFTEGYVPDFSVTSENITDTDIDFGAYGYQSIADVENDDYNLRDAVVHNTDGTAEFKEGSFLFNSGDNETVALVIRGIGGDGSVDPEGRFDTYGWINGDQEIRVDFVKILVDN